MRFYDSIDFYQSENIVLIAVKISSEGKTIYTYTMGLNFNENKIFLTSKSADSLCEDPRA